jgi:hypothetical protein
LKNDEKKKSSAQTGKEDNRTDEIDELLSGFSEISEQQRRAPSGISKFFLKLILGKDYNSAMENSAGAAGDGEQWEQISVGAKLKKVFKGKKLRHGSVALGMFSLFLALVVVLNVISIYLVDRFPLLNVDMTQGSIYSLSDSTKEILKSLESDVSIVILARETDCTQPDITVDPYSQIPLAHELILRYAGYSDHIKIDYVDLTRNPEFLDQYPEYLDILGQYSIVVGSERRTRVTSFYEMLPSLSSEYNTSSESVDISSSYTETLLTSLIKTVTIPKVPQVAFLDGLDSEQGVSYLLNLISLNGYEIIQTDIRTDDIPANADIAVLASPIRDITPSQAAKIDEWLNNGGNLGKTLMVYTSPFTADTPNLNDLLGDWGLEISRNIVYEGTASEVIPGATNSSFYAQYYQSDYVGDLFDRNIRTAVSLANEVVQKFEVKGDFVTNPILSTTATGFSGLQGDSEKFDTNALGDMAHRVVMANSTQYRQNANGEDIRSDIIVAPASIYEADYLSNTAFGNSRLLLNTYNERSGIGDQTINIEVKYLSAVDFSVETGTIKVISAIIGFVVPALVILGGLFVYIRRRYL